MYTVSDRFLDALCESHQVATEVVLFRTDGRVERLDHTGGSVTVDRGQATRRTCSVTLADTSLIPLTAIDKLSVYGAQLRISRGIRYADGSTEMVPVGLFRIDEVSGDRDEGPVTVSGKSLEAMVADDKFTAVTKVSGMAVAAITSLIQGTLPSATVVNRGTDVAIGPRVYDIEGDRWAAVVEIAAAMGAEVYTDADGVFIISELPDLLSVAPAWSITAGEGGAYISANRGMSLDGVYNAVLARGENTETDAPPVAALVIDDDPTSPTYWSGPFGHRAMFYSSATLTTVNACTSAATLKLRAARAPNASADITSLPNPALEPGDVIRVVYPDRTGELHQVQSFTVPLEPGGTFTLATISAREDA
ncbi:DUF5047 domain-containing protein [Streptomyces sp. SAJ15]|uniref:DUF5047 domain-containing protein n=1 Tax=Streptomyces sp. SAJ15 TaxID=2011095 RepID=UPI001185F250|nr:DUF5047 domain-containing protein [Streptomyces sp. SAJ15]TVL89734.1 DUF5047 domain-containing protein [Streptomyces sp. SAJ15]